MEHLKKFKIILVFLFSYLLLVILVYLVESHSENANINSVFDAFWYSFVTITTVGYGDVYPTTIFGKIIGSLFLIGSIGFLGYVVGKTSERINEIRENKKMGYQGNNFENHIVIIGWNSFAQSITTQLINADRKIAIATDNKDDIDLIYEEFGKENVHVLFCELKNITFFKYLNISKAIMVFVNLEADIDKLILILNIKKIHQEGKFLVTLENSDLIDTFQSAGVTYVLSKNEIASKLIASYIFEPDVADYASDLLASAKDDCDYDIQQFLVIESNPYKGKKYGEIFSELKSNYNVLLIGVCKIKDGERKLLKLPTDDVVVDLGDYLIMILNGTTEKIIKEIFQVTEGI